MWMWKGCASGLLFWTIQVSVVPSLVVILEQLGLYCTPLILNWVVGSPGPPVIWKSKPKLSSVLAGTVCRYQGIGGHFDGGGKPVARAFFGAVAVGASTTSVTRAGSELAPLALAASSRTASSFSRPSSRSRIFSSFPSPTLLLPARWWVSR